MYRENRYILTGTFRYIFGIGIFSENWLASEVRKITENLTKKSNKNGQKFNQKLYGNFRLWTIRPSTFDLLVLVENVQVYTGKNVPKFKTVTGTHGLTPYTTCSFRYIN